MKVAFAGTNIDFLKKIASRVCKKDDTVSFYEFELSNYGGIANSLVSDLNKNVENVKLTDVFVFDYRMFEFCEEYFYKELDKIVPNKPIVFYNDPFVFSENRVARWIQKNNSRVLKLDFEIVIPFLVELSSALEDPILSLSVETFQSLESIRQKNLFIKDNIDEHKLRDELPPSLSKLFSILYESKNKPISIEEISTKMNISSGKKGKSSVYAYISRLKRFSSERKLFNLVRTSKGFYKIVLSV